MKTHKITPLAIALFSLISSAAFADSLTLAQCKVGGEEIRLELTGQGSAEVRFAGKETTVYVARRDRTGLTASGYTPIDFLLANGSVVNIRRDAATGAMQIWDRLVAYGPCDAGTEFVDDVALDNLVLAASAQKPLYQFAACTNASGGVTNFTVRAGVDINTAVFEADFPEARGGEHIVYVAKSWSSLNGLGHFNTFFTGQGAFSYAAAGPHSKAVLKFELRETPSLDHNALKVVLDARLAPDLNDDLGSCKINNLTYARNLIPSTDPE